ncbi:MAG: sialidase family protein, partial [Planctomycetaceae bacterium]
MNPLLIATLIATAAPAEPVYFDELVFPPEPMHNHSSSIVETPNGDLLVAWFRGHGEKTDDTLVISGARKRKGEDKWGEPFVMADNQGLPDQNSVLYIDPASKLYLWWISSLANTRETYLLQCRTSTDYGADGPPKWEWNDTILREPPNLAAVMDKMAAGVDEKFGTMFDFEEKYRKRLEHGVRMARTDQTYLAEYQDAVWGRLPGMLSWMPRCQPIMLSDNRMLIGLYSDVYCTSLSCFTEDGGKTWEYGEPMADYGLIQPAIIQ